MRGSSRLLLVAVVLCALASAAPGALAAQPQVRVLSDGQGAILSKGSVKARVTISLKGDGVRTVSVRGASQTFDEPKPAALTETRRLRFRHSGSKSVKLVLRPGARGEIRSCEARTLRVSAGSGAGSAPLVRDTAACRPRPINLSRASECDLIGQQAGSLCMLPFPDDFYTVKDKSSNTGRRIAFKSDAMPANSSQVHIDPTPYARNDGFSPGQAIVLRVPGLDNPEALANTNAVPINHQGRYTDRNTPVVVIDTQTGKRWPIWVEIDSNAPTPEETALLIHPAKNFTAKHRYVVALRNLKDSSGEKIAAPEGFRYYRDELPSSKPAINKQRGRFERVFKGLRSAGVDRSNLYLAWDFTVGSDQRIASRMLQIRDDAFAQLGDTDLADGVVTGTAPAFNVTGVDLNPDSDLARRVTGTFTVPCYMTSVGGVPCAPGSVYNLDAGKPAQNGTWTANFICIVPKSIATDTGHSPGRPVVYGHGLLGSAGEVNSDAQRGLSQAHKMMHCATDEIGFANADIPSAAIALSDMSKFPTIAERTQQGLLNELYLGRLMDNPAGFASVAAFHEDQTAADTEPNDDVSPTDPVNPSVIDTSKLYYNGNSQGAILGGAFTAISPDATRTTLGVGGMNYSVLLNRSKDFDTYQAIFNPSYPSKLTQALVLSMVQILWDSGEANGYARRMTSNPLPDTPAHEVLMNVGFGDQQVTNWQADVEARTIGARAHRPVVYENRWPGVDPLFGIPRIASYPYSGSAIVYWDAGPLGWDPSHPDLGNGPPPLVNQPNRVGEDPHELPRRTAAERQMVSDFLQPDAQSHITDTCNGGPCYSGTFTGP